MDIKFHVVHTSHMMSDVPYLISYNQIWMYQLAFVEFVWRIIDIKDFKYVKTNVEDIWLGNLQENKDPKPMDLQVVTNIKPTIHAFN